MIRLIMTPFKSYRHPLLTFSRLKALRETQRQSSSLDINQSSLVSSDLINKVKQLKTTGVPIVHHHGYVCDLPINHRFAMRKFHGVMRYLRMDNVISSKQIIKPDPVTEDIVKTVHTDDYVDKFFNGKTSVDEQRLTGFVWSEGIVSRCRLETGGTLLASRLALERGVACSTGGGTHHAFPSYGSGYCLINDMAITAAQLIKEETIQKVLIVDLDVHQGDGTAFMFEDCKDIFTFSMHCDKNFPFKKQQSDIDVALDDRLEDKEYMEILQSQLPWILDSFRPDLVIYDAGVDPHIKDELGKLNLSDQGLFDRDKYVIDLALGKGIPVATVIGGGYQKDVDALSLRHTIVHRAATKVWFDRK